MQLDWVTSPLGSTSFVRLLDGVRLSEYDKKVVFLVCLALRSQFKGSSLRCVVPFTVRLFGRSSIADGEGKKDESVLRCHIRERSSIGFVNAACS